MGLLGKSIDINVITENADKTLTQQALGNMSGKPTPEQLLSILILEVRGLRAEIAPIIDAAMRNQAEMERMNARPQDM